MERRTEIVELSTSQAARALSAVLPGAMLRSYALASSGRANTNYFLDTARGKLVLRLHVRDGSVGPKERALQRLVSPQVPTPQVLGGASAGEALDHAYSILSFVPGDSLEQALRSGNQARLLATASHLGSVLGRLTQHRFTQAGDLVAADDQTLVVQPWPFSDFFEWVLHESPAAARLGALRNRLSAFLQRAKTAYPDDWPTHLVHGDFNPTNILIDEQGRVSAVLDWEFSHAGQLWSDLGNLFRYRAELPLPDFFVPTVLQGLADTGLTLPAHWRALALISDLSSACEFLSSPDDRPQTHAQALVQIRSTLAELGG